MIMAMAATAPLPLRAAEPPTYTLAVVPQFDLRQLESAWRPIIERLEASTGVRFVLVTEQSIPLFEKGLHAGAYDFAYMNPFHYVLANRRQGYAALVRDTETPLSGLVVVRKDSGITDVKALNGRKVAFPAPNAFGAALIPRAEFVRKFGIQITESYVRSHDSAYLNVVLGLADAAGGIRATFERQKPEIREMLRVVHETAAYTPHPLAAHPRVSADLVSRVKAEMLNIGRDPAMAPLLAAIPIKTIGIAADSDYDSLRILGLEAFVVEP
ncbi:phosphate ABC transporter [Paramagnetospirillum marisnigri]|uniref:Phosphate ABC transporter n=2 Tax=Paramagnetospirillum marisnigri TaxID=1285242 RepID=A0A178MFK4_9PROT|nr:phosphate ABC transporter [Paramagnetospirillum marisnigri]